MLQNPFKINAVLLGVVLCFIGCKNNKSQEDYSDSTLTYGTNTYEDLEMVLILIIAS